MKKNEGGPTKRQVTFNLPVDVIQKMRAAAIHFSGPPHRLTLAAIAEDGIRRELQRITKIFNNGKPIPSYEEQALRPGRPIGSGRKK